MPKMNVLGKIKKKMKNCAVVRQQKGTNDGVSEECTFIRKFPFEKSYIKRLKYSTRADV